MLLCLLWAQSSKAVTGYGRPQAVVEARRPMWAAQDHPRKQKEVSWKSNE